ncbi:DUF3244 domain-containing protein [Bacteroides oleiciplenus]|uniref:DUF3244 domain-containing protein n=1 Tax=Bacteroides oleiciplenus TaxID=626931 RepID=A0A3E5BNP1_9BACE|nr:DUF3244 domain-containing protein [Bacteroides oleiciplenus]RGN39208.1 DUF3244 domain-containing protein [Bacteroides oleiciplenus]
MKTKFVFCLVSWFCLLSIGVVRADSSYFVNGAEIMLSGNDVPFQKPKGAGQEQRSIPIFIPISAFLSNKQSIELDFYESIGDIEIIISQNGTTIYSLSENIRTSILKVIQLPQKLSGSFLLEIKGDNGAYAFGYFKL